MSDDAKPYALADVEDGLTCGHCGKGRAAAARRIRATVEALERAEADLDVILQRAFRAEAERDEARAEVARLRISEMALAGHRRVIDSLEAEVARLQDLHTRCAAFDDQPGPSCVTLAAEVARLREALETCSRALATWSKERLWTKQDNDALEQARAALAGTSDREGR